MAFARFDTPCSHCNQTVEEGEEIKFHGGLKLHEDCYYDIMEGGDLDKKFNQDGFGEPEKDY